MSAWSHLPNAAHIDRIIASVGEHPEVWYAAFNGLDGVKAPFSATWYAALHKTFNAHRVSASDAAHTALWAAAAAAACVGVGGAAGAIRALVAFDDCAHYLEMPSEQLDTWAALSGNPAAIMLLPAVVAFEKINELEMV